MLGLKLDGAWTISATKEAGSSEHLHVPTISVVLGLTVTGLSQPTIARIAANV